MSSISSERAFGSGNISEQSALLQINMVATRLAGSWTEGHTHGLVSMDELEVLITAECHLVPPDAVPVTTPAPPSTVRPTGTLSIHFRTCY